MTRPAAAWFAGLLVGAATATAAWVRLAGHPPTARAQLAAIRLGIRALEALPTREWDDEEPMFDKGGILPSGVRTVYNGTGRPIYLGRGEPITEESARRFREAWLKAHRREDG